MVAVEAVDGFDMCRDTVFEVTQKKKNKAFTLAHLHEMRGQPTHNKHTHTANGHTNARRHTYTHNTHKYTTNRRPPTHPPIYTHTHALTLAHSRSQLTYTNTHGCGRQRYGRCGGGG